MKNTFAFILAAAAGILAASCAKENVSADGTTQNLVPLSFKAVYDDNVKTYLDPIDEEKAHIAFTVGEEISIFYKTTGGAVEKAANNAVCSAYDATTGVATFSALVPEDADLTQEIIAIAGDDAEKGCDATSGSRNIFEYNSKSNNCLRTTIAKLQPAVKDNYDAASFTSFGIASPVEVGKERTIHFRNIPGLVNIDVNNTSSKKIKDVYLYAAESVNSLYREDKDYFNRYSGLVARYYFYISEDGPAQANYHTLPASFARLQFSESGLETGKYNIVVRPDTYKGVKVAFLSDDNKILIADENNGIPEEMLVKRNTTTNLPKFPVTDTAPWEDITLDVVCKTTFIDENGGDIKFTVTGNCPWKISLSLSKNLSDLKISNSDRLFPQDGLGEKEVTLKVAPLPEGQSSATYTMTISAQGPTGIADKKITITQKPAEEKFGSSVITGWLNGEKSKNLGDKESYTQGKLKVESTNAGSTIGSLNISETFATPEGYSIAAGDYYYFAGKYLQFSITESQSGVYELSYCAYTKTTNASGTPPAVTLSPNPTDDKYKTVIYYTDAAGKEVAATVKGNNSGTAKVTSPGYNKFVCKNICVNENLTIKIKTYCTDTSNKVLIDDKCPIIWKRVGDLPTE